MTDYSLDDLHASRDVVWDFEVSGSLAGKLDAAAGTVEGQVAPLTGASIRETILYSLLRPHG